MTSPHRLLLCVLGVLAAGVTACGGGSASSGSSGGGSTPTGVVPTSSFTMSTAAPAATQTVQFTDTSAGSPTSWAWTFGDGATSSQQSPTHAFASAGNYQVTLTVSNSRGSNSSSSALTVSAATSTVNVVLGRPTNSSIAASVMLDVGVQAYVEYGATPGTYASTTSVQTATSAYPVVFAISGLTANTRYYYRLRYKAQSDASYKTEVEHSFQTQRPPGSTFSFAIQGDSHPERVGLMFNADLYALNMRNAASRQPDFYMALGDDFSIEPFVKNPTITQANVEGLFANQRTYFGLVGHSSSVFLVNGNHEQAAAYLLSPTYATGYASNPIFQGNARTAYFALPAPDGFYTGDATPVSGVGLLRDYYAWQWGDALFVVIDPYWHSPVPVDDAVPGVSRATDQWAITMGDEQYAWFRNVLQTSSAKYKFVFEHHVLGTGRGGAALVHQFEWGGYDKNGMTYQLPSKRPTWTKPIHQLMVENKVTIFFGGHDHLFAREKVDGVVYQEVPNPADNSYTAFNVDAYAPARISLPGAVYDQSYGVTMSNAGHLYVTVSPSQVTVAYVRAVLAGDEAKAGGSNNAIAFSYTVTSTAGDQVAASVR